MQKPKAPHKALGLDAKITSTQLQGDQLTRFRTEEVAKLLAPQGEEYLGTVALHIYKTTLGNSVSFVCQRYLEQVSEGVCNSGMSTLLTHTLNWYGRRRRTLDKSNKTDLSGG